MVTSARAPTPGLIPPIRRLPVRILVVDDSATARDLICALIHEDPRLRVCGVADNGRVAVAQALALRPDLVTMDLQMPVMDGMAAIAEIMDRAATRILVLSDVADAANAMAAVNLGALDATRKPTFDDGAAFTRRLWLLAGVPVIRHLRSSGRGAGADADPAVTVPVGGVAPKARDGARSAVGNPIGTAATASPVATSRPLGPNPGKGEGPANGIGIIAIAVSTGGPQALAQLLPALPAGLPAALLIAQHISDGFAHGMATWLSGISPLPVAVATQGEPVLIGRVYLADPATHMTITTQGRILLVPRDPTDRYRPSCDRLLTSVAAITSARPIGVILTGMGRDGAAGIAAIAAAGGITIAQDEASSVVFGMNREAIATGAVQRVLPLSVIADALTELLGDDGSAGDGTGRP